MKQLLQNLRDGKTTVVEVPTPHARPGTALIHTAASLVSAGTERMVVEFAEKNLVSKAASRPDLVRQVIDKARREGLLTTLDSVFNRLDQPMVLGYSSAGVVVELGEGMEGYQIGDRVACAGGNFAVHAEYAVVPRNLLARLPEGVDFESAAFTTLGAIAMHGFRLARPQVGETVAIIGLGLLGLLAATIAQAAGCRVFGIDLDTQRVTLAEKMGVSAVVRSEAESAGQLFSRGRGFDIVLICADTTSNDPIELAGVLARDRAQVVAVGAVGLNIPRKTYYEKEINFQVSRSYGPGRYDPGYEERGRDYPAGFVRWTEGRNLESFVDLLAEGKIKLSELISHRIPIEQAVDAYDIITGKKKEKFLGVLLTYPMQTEDPNRQLDRKVTISQSKPAARDGKITVGVLGAGNYANATFLPAMQKTGRAELITIASGSGVTARHAAQKFGFRFAASASDEVLQDEAINTIVLLTRHNLHASQAWEALKNGKNVYCEKPLGLNTAELEPLAQVLQQPDAPKLMVGFNRRFAPLAVQLKQFLAGSAEPIAMHYRINAGYIPAQHWVHDPLIGGGRILGEACHFIDFLTFLVGTPPISVTAAALPDSGRYSQDNVLMTFTFGDGSLGSISYLANGDKSCPKELVEVFRGGLVATLDDFRSLQMIKHVSRKTVSSALRQDKGHAASWSAFLTSVEQNQLPPISYQHLWGVTLASFAAVEAVVTGERVAISNFNFPNR